MLTFWQGLRAEIARGELSNTMLALVSCAFAWVITDALRALF